MRFGRSIAVALSALVLMAPNASQVWAALQPLDLDRETVVPQPDLLVRRAQQALSKLGLYLGPEDGRLNDATATAVHIFRRSNDLGDTFSVDKELVAKLEYAVGVRRLMRQLENARAESIQDARSLLLAHPATRDLIQNGDKVEAADPTRDVNACFDNPTALCLLTEASESAKAIAKAELRDWALGEILIAEARAGLGERAMQTAAHIGDPRLIITALRDISEAQAAAGHHGAAIAAADIIPDAEKRADARAAIAGIQLRRGDAKDAVETAGQLLHDLDGVTDLLKRIDYRTRAAVILAGSGRREQAEEELSIAEPDARQLERDSSRSAGLRHVASALANMEETARALDLLESVSSPSDRIPVLMSAAEAQARAGDAASALATASSIADVRYRAVVLGRIASAQAEAGRLGDADATLDIALAAIDRIDRPYARSYAISRIALALSTLYDWSDTDTEAKSAGRRATMKRAVETANLIDDRRPRAHTLWLIADRQRAVKDGGWEDTERLAIKATEEVVGNLSRVWMYADLAEGHALKGENDAAWRAFDRGLALARETENTWSRARTLAKLAATLIQLVDPGRGRETPEP